MKYNYHSPIYSFVLLFYQNLKINWSGYFCHTYSCSSSSSCCRCRCRILKTSKYKWNKIKLSNILTFIQLCFIKSTKIMLCNIPKISVVATTTTAAATAPNKKSNVIVSPPLWRSISPKKILLIALIPENQKMISDRIP